ncbi:MAG: YraN family protein [Clostridia bacterium]|nr:YraN family protein [Clostridia bacterium]
MAVKDGGKAEDKHNINLGKKGEKQACAYLKREGWKILERNYKNPFGEIDIIAKKDEVYAFIEVKTRLSDIFGTPSEAVGSMRKRKYILGANYYFANKMIDCTVRFDVIEIFKGQLNHIENAFWAK